MLRGIFTFGGFTLLSRLAGFARDIVMAAVLGAGPLADAFVVAQRLPNHFRAIFAEGAFNVAFLPAFTTTLQRDGKAKALALAEQVQAILLAVLLVVLVAVAASIVVGVLLGLVSGYFGGWLDRVLVVVADAIYAFPSLLLAILLAIVISGGQSSMWGGILAAALSITVVFVPQYFRVIRAEVVRIKAEAFVDSARVLGTGHWRIMTRHVLRNSTRTLPLIVTLNASEAILTLAGLGFLGFGIEPTAAAEWGYDLQRAVADVTSGIWWTSLFPGLAIVLAAMGMTLMGESLNDLADPRLRSRARSGKVSGAVEATSVESAEKGDDA